MLRLCVLVVLVSLLFIDCAGANVADSPGQRHGIGKLMNDAIADGLIAGGVVLVGDSREDFFCEAYGKLSGSGTAQPVETGSLFDIASLTKIVATAPAVMKLAEEGRLRLDDPVGKWFAEFNGTGRDELLVLHLLTHTSGLRDFHVSGPVSIHDIVAGAASRPVKGRPGCSFRYADINFILLGELVGRVVGVPLDVYAASRIFVPLHMTDTGFNPGSGDAARCAATLDRDNTCLYGRVQDNTARLLGGVAGHSGLFSTAGDLAHFCRMILNHGAGDGRIVLTPQSVSLATMPYACDDGKVLRGLGWDISSPYSSPRGSAFSEISFGHTGYSGCSVWIDPSRDVFIIFLAVRLDYKRKKQFNQLRGDLSTTAGLQVADWRRKPDFARKFE